jgi:hypothetical protein
MIISKINSEFKFESNKIKKQFMFWSNLKPNSLIALRLSTVYIKII